MIQEGAFLHGGSFPARLTTKAPTEVSPSLDELTERLLALKKKLDDLKRQQAGGDE
ncbi:hypothetical protein [Bradyrhizobium elkanii]